MLSPQITEMILSGKHRPDLTLQKLRTAYRSIGNNSRTKSFSCHRLQRPGHSFGRYRSSWLCNHALRPDEFFFLFSAHLFFIKIDNRLRPAAVKWCFRDDDAPFLEDSVLAGMVRPVLAPSSAAIARSRRFLSAFSSDTIFCVSKIGSFNVAGTRIVPDLYTNPKQLTSTRSISLREGYSSGRQPRLQSRQLSRTLREPDGFGCTCPKTSDWPKNLPCFRAAGSVESPAQNSSRLAQKELIVGAGDPGMLDSGPVSEKRCQLNRSMQHPLY